MKSSNHNGRRTPRRPVERSLLALAVAQADALRSREVLRRVREAEPPKPAALARPAGAAAGEAAQRAAFAAAIARAEFGRFYFKGEPERTPKRRRPERNGKG